jgi:hypothetical protein
MDANGRESSAIILEQLRCGLAHFPVNALARRKSELHGSVPGRSFASVRVHSRSA